MVQFSTIIKKFKDQGEKTGWTYIDVPEDIASQLKPNNKKTFRVKGSLDHYEFTGIALIPMGGGDFIMALNASIRKVLGKRKGAGVSVRLEADNDFVIKPPAEFQECLADEPRALEFFTSLAKSHQGYFVKWIDSARTDPTRVKRIAQAVSALSKGQGFGEMLRAQKKDRHDLQG
jgi:hypothetical protein